MTISVIDSPVIRFVSYCMLEHHLKQLFNFQSGDDWSLSIGHKVPHPHITKIMCWKHYLIHNSSLYIVESYPDKTIKTKQLN